MRYSLALASALIAGVTFFRASLTYAAPTTVRKSAGKILFTSSAPNQKPEIYSIRGDGSGLRKISRRPFVSMGAAWSPDKKSIVMAIATKVGIVQKRDVWRYNLAIMNTQSGVVRNINIAGHPKLKTYDATFAPSGKEILFVGHTASSSSQMYDLYQVRVDGSHLKRLTSNGSSGNGRFSRDGKKIVFCTLKKGQKNIYAMASNARNRQQLTRSQHDQTPAWSPDGRKITFVSRRSGSYQIYSMNANGSGQKQLTRTTGDSFVPTFSPDGKQISFNRSVGATGQIFVMNADGTHQKPITKNKNMNSYYPTWR